MKETRKNEKIGIGVVGLGYWGPNLVRNFMAHPDVTLLAVCDQNRDLLQRFWNVAPFKTTSFEELLHVPGLEAIIIATPVKTHFPLAQQALMAGFDIWVEKPITFDAVEAQKLVDISRSQGRILFVDHTFVYNTAIQKTKEVIDSGELGDIIYFDSMRTNLGLIQQDVNVVWDLGPHDLSILNFLLKRDPYSVTAIGASHNDHHMEDIAYITFLYHDGLIAHMNFNWLSPVKVRRIIIGGSKKMLVYDDLESSEKIKIYDRGITVYGTQMDRDGRHQMLINYRSGDVHSPNVENREALAIATDHFVQCLRERKEPISGGLEALKVVNTIAAIQTSLQNSGKAIRFRPST